MNRIPDNMAQALERVSAIEARIGELSGRAAAPAPAGGSFDAALAAASGSARAPLTTQFDGIITDAAQQYGVRPALLRALMQAESSGNPQAVSPAGAQGLMQLMPGTAAGLGVTNPFDPAQNIMGGARYLRQQLDRFGGDERLALAAYNAGPGAVQRYNGVPPYPETQQYVNRVLSLAGEE